MQNMAGDLLCSAQICSSSRSTQQRAGSSPSMAGVCVAQGPQALQQAQRATRVPVVPQQGGVQLQQDHPWPERVIVQQGLQMTAVSLACLECMPGLGLQPCQTAGRGDLQLHLHECLQHSRSCLPHVSTARFYREGMPAGHPGPSPPSQER